MSLTGSSLEGRGGTINAAPHDEGAGPGARSAVPASRTEPHPATLRFADERLEADFRTELFGNVLVSVRAGHVLGIVTWALWGLIIRQYTAAAPEVDLTVRFLVLIPILVVGLGVTFLPAARRFWEAEAVAVLLLNALVWTIYVSAIAGVPFDLGYVGVILIMTFSYTLVRLRFLLMAGAGLAMIGLYFAAVLAVGDASSGQILLALYYLCSFYVLGTIASYTMERFTRLLFLRERQLATERERSESLLLNVLPRDVAERLKEQAPAGSRGAATALADDYPEVAVLFADLAGFTEQAGRTPPDALVACLNDVFSEMDLLADRYGLEKIKTAGDAYMAVAGVPVAVSDPAGPRRGHGAGPRGHAPRPDLAVGRRARGSRRDRDGTRRRRRDRAPQVRVRRVGRHGQPGEPAPGSRPAGPHPRRRRGGGTCRRPVRLRPARAPGAQGQGLPGGPLRGGSVEPGPARHGVTGRGPPAGGYVPVKGVQTWAILPPVATNPPKSVPDLSKRTIQ